MPTFLGSLSFPRLPLMRSSTLSPYLVAKAFSSDRSKGSPQPARNGVPPINTDRFFHQSAAKFLIPKHGTLSTVFVKSNSCEPWPRSRALEISEEPPEPSFGQASPDCMMLAYRQLVDQSRVHRLDESDLRLWQCSESFRIHQKSRQILAVYP
jgi:hypothetical protein